MVLSMPVRFADGAGNAPAAANWNDDFDWLASLALGLGFLANGGMESWAAGTSFSNPTNGTTLADSWTEVKSGTTPCTADVSREASVVDSGLYSMKVNVTGAGSSDSYWAIKQSQGTPSAFGALTVVLGVKVKVATGNKVRCKVYDGTNTAYSSYHTGDGTWQLLQAQLTCVANPSEITATIEINPANFTDAVYMDSIYLYSVPAAISARALQSLTFTPLSGVGVFLPLSGGTMTGAINMGSHKITSLTNGSSAQDAAAFGQLKVLQVVQATQVVTFTSTSTSYASQVGVSITPASSSSKFVVIACMPLWMNGAGTGYASIFRNSTNLAGGTAQALAITSVNGYVPCGVSVYDSPATGSAITYSLETKADGTHAVGLNDGEATITVYEVV